MKILGLSAFYHDSAAALIIDGEIMAAAQEERFTRVKHDAGFPTNAINFCLAYAKITAQDIDQVIFYDKPFLKFERLLETHIRFAPKGLKSFTASLPLWIQEKLFQKNLLIKNLNRIDGNADWLTKLRFSEHHLSHAASAFYPSPFDEAVILTMDGVGEWATSSVYIGSGSKIRLEKEIKFPHSLGLLYSAFTYYAGFKVNSGEYKLMGLAPYGTPKYTNLIKENLIDIKDDGSFRLDMKYFDYCTALKMTNKAFHCLFGGPPRVSNAPVSQKEMDLAASIQAVLEEVILKICRSLAEETKIKNLCLAGGVALNCVANSKILRDKHFDNIWIQPAAGDAGAALGAGLVGYYSEHDIRKVYPTDAMNGSYLGPEFSQAEIEARLKNCGAVFETLTDEELIQRTVAALTSEKAVGWFQGRMEFGPRALGAESMLGDPRSSRMQSTLNLKVKYRESFRPFAPSVLREDVKEWFQFDGDSPYMLFVADIAEKQRLEVSEKQRNLFGIEKLNVTRSTIPAVTHVDYSSRLQTVHKETNPKYAALLRAFKITTGCPMLVNTSFNIRGEPIVCTPEDAFGCFMGTEIEVLCIGNSFLQKEKQTAKKIDKYQSQFQLD